MNNGKTSGSRFERESLLGEKRGTERDMLAALLPPGWRYTKGEAAQLLRRFRKKHTDT